MDEQRRIRIRLAIAAYAYEFDQPIMSDGEYDALALRVDASISTGHAVLDRFFREKYSADTGQWIHDHPELDKVRRTYYYLKYLGNSKSSKISRSEKRQPEKKQGSDLFDLA